MSAFLFNLPIVPMNNHKMDSKQFEKIQFRPIQIQDSAELAVLIRSVLKEHGADKPGTVYTDPTTDSLFELFQTEGSFYWVALLEKEIIGGCGIFPTLGLRDKCAELVKLYVSKSSRGTGIGYKLIEICLQHAKEAGYSSVYLETLPELSKAAGLYAQIGFQRLKKPMGNSGHYACDLWMLKEI
jgi:putative acetyltransferase